jgi:hypothetical protein
LYLSAIYYLLMLHVKHASIVACFLCSIKFLTSGCDVISNLTLMVVVARRPFLLVVR